MIINSKADLDAAPDEVKSLFMQRLAAGINHWEWIDGEWSLIQNTSTIEQFGFTIADFPDAPKPEKPDYNPDEREAQRKSDEADANRKAAYIAEADPLFFKAQREEATWQEWLDKVFEIKERFPKQ